MCDLLDRWPLLYNGQELEVASLGVSLAFATAVACMVTWTVFRGALGIMPLAPLTSRLIVRAAGGALCGVGLATLFLLLTLHRFAAVTLDETVGNSCLPSFRFNDEGVGGLAAVQAGLRDGRVVTSG